MFPDSVFVQIWEEPCCIRLESFIVLLALQGHFEILGIHAVELFFDFFLDFLGLILLLLGYSRILLLKMLDRIFPIIILHKFIFGILLILFPDSRSLFKIYILTKEVEFIVIGVQIVQILLTIQALLNMYQRFLIFNFILPTFLFRLRSLRRQYFSIRIFRRIINKRLFVLSSHIFNIFISLFQIHD